MKCMHCGAEYQVRDIYCPNCGKPTSPGAKENKPKKPFYKKWWFWAIVVFVVIGAIGGESDEDEEPISAEVVETTVPTEEPTDTTEEPIAEETEAATEETEASVSDDAVLNLIEYMVSSAYENCTVQLEDGVLTINVWTDGLAYGATLAKSGNASMLSEWDNMVENTKSICNATVDAIHNMGRYDIIVVWNVLNDLDTDNVLLSIISGEVLYDAVYSE